MTATMGSRVVLSQRTAMASNILRTQTRHIILPARSSETTMLFRAGCLSLRAGARRAQPQQQQLVRGAGRRSVWNFGQSRTEEDKVKEAAAKDNRKAWERREKVLRTADEETANLGKLEAVEGREVEEGEESEEAYVPTRTYGFEEISALAEELPPNTYLIDTREPNELRETGTITNSLNIPITSRPDAFRLPREAFLHHFGFEKPDPKTATLVTYCRAGIRARAAAELARDSGYRSLGVYPGSWIEWDTMSGPTEEYEPRGSIWELKMDT